MSDTKQGGIGFVGLLTILFIGLKLTGYITWSMESGIGVK
jgi:hypothetical protein